MAPNSMAVYIYTSIVRPEYVWYESKTAGRAKIMACCVHLVDIISATSMSTVYISIC